MRIKLFRLSIIVISAILIINTALARSNEPVKIDPAIIERFGMAIAEIKKLYVSPVDDKKIFDSAIRGILAGLDPHSMYLDEKSFRELKTQTTGEFVGIGIEITQEKNLVKVISPIDDTPAQKAGIKAGDFILAINHKPLLDTPLPEVAQKLRGKKGVPVTLTILRKTDKKPQNVTIVRSTIHIQSVKSKLLDNTFGYVRITHFQETTAPKVKAAVLALEKQTNQHLEGLVLDLRNNPGGLLDSGVSVADLFLDSNKLKKNKEIVSTKGRVEEINTTMFATPGDVLSGTPMVVLINQGSASASEIVAGALQDHKRAIIMGQHSFGKGSLQTVLPLDDKTGIKLTTGLYYTPNGRSIQAKGIQPDIVVNDLKIQKEKEDMPFLWSTQEKDLKGHLVNEQQTNLKQLLPHQSPSQVLAISDYQLHEALQLLKSLRVLKQGNLS